MTETAGKQAAAKPKVQRIKMRMYKHPVKFDGSVVQFAPDGESFVVEFDGPLPRSTFYRYSDTMVVDKKPVGKSVNGFLEQAPGSQIWEVL